MVLGVSNAFSNVFFCFFRLNYHFSSNPLEKYTICRQVGPEHIQMTGFEDPLTAGRFKRKKKKSFSVPRNVML